MGLVITIKKTAPILTTKEIIIPEKKPAQIVKKKTVDLAEEITEEDLAKMATQMAEMEKKLTAKGGGKKASAEVKEDMTWTKPIIEWAEKNNFKYDLETNVKIRMDIYHNENYEWRITIIRYMLTMYNVGFYFDIQSTGYPRTINLESISKNDLINGLNYVFKGRELFKGEK